MVKIMKFAKETAVNGLTAYGASKITGTTGQIALNVLPQAVPQSVGMLFGGLIPAFVVENFGSGALLKKLAEYMAAFSVVNALTNGDPNSTNMIDKTVGKLDSQIDGMLSKVSNIGAKTTAGYLPRATAGYLRRNTAGYQPVNQSMGFIGLRAGVSRAGMRGYTSVHGF